MRISIFKHCDGLCAIYNIVKNVMAIWPENSVCAPTELSIREPKAQKSNVDFFSCVDIQCVDWLL
jgi:hypothetical protein